MLLKVSEQCSLPEGLKDPSMVKGEQIGHPGKATEKLVSIKEDPSHGLGHDRRK